MSNLYCLKKIDEKRKERIEKKKAIKFVLMYVLLAVTLSLIGFLLVR